MISWAVAVQAWLTAPCRWHAKLNTCASIEFSLPSARSSDRCWIPTPSYCDLSVRHNMGPDAKDLGRPLPCFKYGTKAWEAT